MRLWPGLCSDPTGELTALPQTPSLVFRGPIRDRGWEGRERKGSVPPLIMPPPLIGGALSDAFV